MKTPEVRAAEAIWAIARKESLPENVWLTATIMFRQNKTKLIVNSVMVEFKEALKS